MNKHYGNQKIIAKNTVMLYLRMMVLMIVSLYTTRVVLNVLGETNYGIYNIVGSVVVSMVFIQNSLMSATQRFLSYEMGLKGKGDVAKVFSSSLNLHLKFFGFILLFLETFGLWFLNKVLDIPEDRTFAANIVYQLSIFTFCLNLIRIPYNAIIVSYENMNIFAALSIAEAFLKLSIVIALKSLLFDKLIAYGIMIFVITFIINELYIKYCRKYYREDTVFNIHGDKEVIKKLRGFLGWNMLGGVTGVATNEGPNYFMNCYLGVSVNAAMGIAKQVSGAVYQFASNFQVAFNPQIVKAYASHDRDYLFGLINKTSALSFALLFIFAFPIILCSDFIFHLWLVEVPEYTVVFSVIIIIGQLISALAGPLWMVAHATGDIKKYQIFISCILLMIVPASFIILELGMAPYYVLIFQVFLQIIVYIYRLWYVKAHVDFPVKPYLHEVVMKSFGMVLIICPIPIFLSYHAVGFFQNIVVVLTSMGISCAVFFFLGLDKGTRERVAGFIKNKILFLRRGLD